MLYTKEKIKNKAKGLPERREAGLEVEATGTRE
jgi:hypothetical protein